ncbi:leucine-rich repeat-containing protein 15-like [Zophobas morio]|uniref:leucine-rich repeat-containing protein 15-like n=1 Tax=Zophobas morio TaxID=2755281 RepID=UPI0030831152
MRSSLINLLLCIFLLKLSNTEKVTFKNVTVQWYVGNETQDSVYTSDNLKKIIPVEEEKVPVWIQGSIPILYEKSVSDIPNLNILSLSGVGMEEIKPGAFGNLPLLKALLLDSNNLTQIKTDTFVDLNVSYIDLSFNSIVLLQPGAFKNIKAERVDLRNNKLAELPSRVFENFTLENLILRDNLLHTIASSALSKIALRTLSLFGNKLEEIEPEVFDIQELLALNLDDNLVKLLRPGDLRNLPNLKILRLARNELKEIPKGVFNNTKLTRLELNANKIAKIASKAFDDMPELEILFINSNNLTQWDNNWLRGAKSLVHISVNFNQITEIPDEAFKNYPRVKIIDLKGNKIGKISAKAFDKLERVDYYLNLASNDIDSWNPDLLGNVSIGGLGLNGNKLQCIEGELKTVFKNVEVTNLRNNPWNEECVKKIEEFIPTPAE